MIDADVNALEGTRSNERHSADMAPFISTGMMAPSRIRTTRAWSFPISQAARGADDFSHCDWREIADGIGVRVVVRDESGMQVYCANLTMNGDTAIS